MSSILKILVDIQCLVYCDFEQVGEAFPDSIFKIELRKGTYILEFRVEAETIVSQEYTIQEDNQDYLLRINLAEEVFKSRREQKSIEIANTNADIDYKNGSWWIVNNDTGCRIRLLYNIEDYSYSIRKTFDMVGLRSVNIGGEKEYDEPYPVFIRGGKWGCVNKQGEIQIPIIYDDSIYFYNEKVTRAFLDGKAILINKYGEELYGDSFDSLRGNFFQNQIVCKNGKYGVIDTDGKYIIPTIYEDLNRLDENDIRFIIVVNNKYGIVDYNNNLLLPCHYDSIPCIYGSIKSDRYIVRVCCDNKWGAFSYDFSKKLPCIYDTIKSNRYIISVCCNNKWGVFDNNLKIIVPTEYEIFDKDYSFNGHGPVLVRKNGDYGILNIDISKPDNIASWDGKLKRVSEVVPCVYNALYNEYGQKIEAHDVVLYYLDRFFFVKKDNETLHCYKYKLQKNEHVNSLSTYTAIDIMEFVCESFKRVDGCLIFTNRGISTITVGEIQLSVKLGGKEPAKIITLPEGNKHLLQIDKDLWVFENGKLKEIIENVKLEEYDGKVYGLKRGGKYAIYTIEFVQCTPFEYDSLSINYDTYHDDGVVEFSKIIDNRRLYGEYSCKTKSIISFGFLRSKCTRSLYNWTEKFNFSNKKEGIISFSPQSIVAPFIYDYIRFYTGKKSTVFVVSKEFKNYPQKRYALMSTKFELLTDYIFRYIESSIRFRGDDLDLSEMHLDLIHNDVYSTFDLSLNDIERFAPFLGFECRVPDEYDEYNRPIRSHNEPAENPFINIRLFIDTETTGLPLNDKLPFTDSDNWPYLVQVALIIEDDNYGILAKRNIILKPDGYIIPESSTKVHGISNERAVKNGEDRDKVISFLDLVLYNSDIIIGHNVSFDLNVIKSEIIRIKGMENALFIKKKHSVIDTMKIGMDICKLPNLSFYSHPSQPYKYPKLDELYYKLFNKYFDNQHDAMADVQATYDCYYELKRKSE